MHGEVWMSEDPQGVCVYEPDTKIGTIYTVSREFFEAMFHKYEWNMCFSEFYHPTLGSQNVYDILSLRLEDWIPKKFNYTVNIITEPLKELGRFDHMAWVTSTLAAGGKCFVVRDSGNIVGVAYAWESAGLGQLFGLVVDEPFRRRGIGQALLQARLHWLRLQVARSALMEVASGNEASRLNALKAGFSLTGRIYEYSARCRNP
jgi:ribosomal protein S18 acetylase RimI-like enzyme